ncbi:hypothetical protein OTSGILL_1006 [Orientia tsutsugamushi str. Gilliam]|uniref:Uncharacterized protein n=1 Tax=Orientia tsutsugamushi str. Gilliam TaxID=1359184 RepID=A0A0F3MCB5_ORITS|nr:hypothetical protein [Orientia tsutsugamushi]KJV53112.1 hypothetical protein OTSGILL_1006 [Orientia tsutsugamushi str. Gilliam]SPR04110.1 Uncharacterised protein [Orientia tsutsugamushi str. Gilliam]
MNNIYSTVVSMVNNVTSNFNFSHVKACLLSPRVSQLFVKSTNKAIEYYEICKAIFIHQPDRDNFYGHNGVKVLHDVFNCGVQTCIGKPSLTVPPDLTSGINGKGIVITGLFNNSRDNNSLYDSLQEWSEGKCKIIPNCNVKLIVENIQNMMDDSASEKTEATFMAAAGAGAGVGIAVSIVTFLIVCFFCRSKKNDCCAVKKYTDENTNPSNFMEKVKDSTNCDNMIIHLDAIHEEEPIYECVKDATGAAATVEMSYV